MRCMRPAWRISTYSSRLEPVMARNLTRSSRGLEGSSASSRTRRLNCIQEWSRPVKSFSFCFVLAMSVSRTVLASLQRFAGELEWAVRVCRNDHGYRMGKLGMLNERKKQQDREGDRVSIDW